MDNLGLDIAKAKFDAHLIAGTAQHYASFANTQTGFEHLVTWLQRWRSQGATSLHACMEATGNWGLDLAAFLYAAGTTVSIVNPRQIKAFGDSELARNKTDRLDAALIARFCRAHVPPGWTPPTAHMRELREMVRRCATLKAQRTQELNRQNAGFASSVIAASITRLIAHLDQQLAEITAAIRKLIAANPTQKTNFTLLCSIPGIGEVTAALILAELPNIAEFEPKALAAFAGLSPQERSSGQSRRTAGISRIGNPMLRSTLYMSALSARRHNQRLAGFVQRMTTAGKPKKVILIAIARRLLVYAHAVIRTGKPFVQDPEQDLAAT